MPPRKSQRLASITNTTSAAPQSEVPEPDNDEENLVVIRKPAKRARTSKTPVTKNSRKAGRLSLLPTMPLDILFQIFEQLHPKDLLALAKVSKTFRTTLLAPSAVTIWKNARVLQEAPEPCSGVSEPRWALLIFGPCSCSACGRTTPRMIDFVIQRRLCKSCATENLVSRWRVPFNFPGDREIILAAMELVPQTHDILPDSCWRPDLEVAVSKYQSLKQDGTEGELDAWIQERQEYVKHIKEHALLCGNWLQECQIQKTSDNRNATLERREVIKERLLALGHRKEDISGALQSKSANHPTKLNNQIWTRILPGLEQDISAAKNARLAKERIARIAQYTKAFQPVYRDFLKTVQPAAWPHVAPPRLIISSAEFNAITESTTPPTAETFAPLMKHIPSVSLAWRNSVKAHLQEIIKGPDLEAIFSRGLKKKKLEALLANPERIPGLAVMVYTRRHAGFGHDNDYRLWHTAFPGYTSVLRGVHKSVEPHRASEFGWHINTELSQHATRIVKMCGLDPYTATPADMDTANTSFRAASRSPRAQFTRNMDEAIFADLIVNWRGVLQDFAAGGRQDWVLLHPDDEEQVISFYEPDSEYQAQDEITQWVCNRCPGSTGTKDYQNLFVHVQKKHGIQAVMLKDIVPAQSELPPRSKGLLQDEGEDLMMHCGRCWCAHNYPHMELNNPVDDDEMDLDIMELDEFKDHITEVHDWDGDATKLRSMALVYQPYDPEPDDEDYDMDSDDEDGFGCGYM